MMCNEVKEEIFISRDLVGKVNITLQSITGNEFVLKNKRQKKANF